MSVDSAAAGIAAREALSLRTRLEARREEIEAAALARISAISDPVEVADPTYVDGLRAALSAALDYGLAAIECAEGRLPAIPVALLAQARLAARNGVGLDVVVRRYVAGYALLGDFLIEEAEAGGPLPGAALRRALRNQAALVDRLLAALGEEYAREPQSRPGGAEQRRAELVGRLLGGEMLDESRLAAELAYDFAATHTALIARGAGAVEAIRALAGRHDCRLLLVHPEEGTAWAWLASRRPLRFEEADLRASPAVQAASISLAVGEPGCGLAGWRLTHRQAAAALPVALRGHERLVRYADVALLAAALRDELLATSLRRTYLEPLRHERDGGAAARETLRAYFAAAGNASSAAKALGLSRRTVSSRLRSIEELLGRRLDGATAELDTALRLDRIDRERPVTHTT